MAEPYRGRGNESRDSLRRRFRAMATEADTQGPVRTRGSGTTKTQILASCRPPSDTKWVGFSPSSMPR